MMAMAVMTMAMMMTMAMPVPVVSTVAVMAVASTVPTVTVTTGECLTRDGQGSRGQRQSSNRRHNDLVDLRHGRLSWVGQSEIRPAMIHS
jgi:hypothetical protein